MPQSITEPKHFRFALLRRRPDTTVAYDQPTAPTCATPTLALMTGTAR